MFFDQLVLLLLALVSIPWMLFPKPFLLKKQHQEVCSFFSLSSWLKLFVFKVLIFFNPFQFLIYHFFLLFVLRGYILFYFFGWNCSLISLNFSFSISLSYLFLRGTKVDPTHCFTVLMTLLNWSDIMILLGMWSLSLMKFLYTNLFIP